MLALPAPRGIMCGQDPLERLPKLRIKNRINNRIKRGIRITQPRQYFECNIRYASLAECRHNIDAEKWYPTNQEDTHDDSNSNGRLVIAHMIWRTVMVVQVDMEGFILLIETLLLFFLI